MSSIFGIVRHEGALEESFGLDRMRAAMAHRGPDGVVQAVDGSAAFGHLALHSTQESQLESLPRKDPDSGLLFTADARLDNRDGLLEQLGLASASCRHFSDGHLILLSFKKWGKRCVDYLLGDFAFALWDNANRMLFCARDPMGIRPFYYGQNSRHFAFASSALAVARASGAAVVVDRGRVSDFLVGELEGSSRSSSFFEGVRRLPPAHTLIMSGQQISLRRYWKPDPKTELRLASDDEYIEAFDEHFTRAVHDRLRGNTPPASMLSGGVDSSTIVGFACRELDGSGGLPLKTYSGLSDLENQCPESQYIRQVIAYCDVDPVLFHPSDLYLYEADLKKIDDILEDPFDDAWTLLKLIYIKAGQQGHRFVMDGIDGDGLASLTSGYPAFLLRAGKIRTAVHELRGQHLHYFRYGKTPIKRYIKSFRSVFVPAKLRRIWREHGIGSRAHTLLQSSLLSPELAREIRLTERVRDYRGYFTADVTTSLRYAHAERMMMPYLTAGIERYARLAAYAGVEQRQPLLDRRLIEFCVSLPWDQKCRDGWSKFAMRKLAERVLPASVAWRPGWEQISGKFSEARSKLNREEEIESALAAAQDLQGMVCKQKVRDRVVKLQNGETDFDQQLVDFVNLARWLKRVA